jgi:predicted metal-dependent hydrolase
VERGAPPQKKERPRDELGRPLSWDAENRLHLEDYDNLPPDENHRLGIEHFNARHFFPAHEAWESAWRQLKGTPDEEFFHGLAQLGAGFTHYMRGNPHGARILLTRAVERIRPYGPRHRGIDVEALAGATGALAAAIQDARATRRALPEVDFPRIEP